MKPHWIASLCLALSASIAQAQFSPPYELKASVAFARDSDQYLMVYSNDAETGPNIYGRVLSPDGSPSGRDFRLSAQVGLMSKPVLAYNPQTQRFLVVWGRKKFGEDRAEVIGLTVGLDGKVIGEEFRVSFSDLYDQRPAIAYCPGRDRFLVTWTGGPEYDFEKGQSDIYGQFVGGDGTSLQGSNFTIAAGAKNQFKSDVTCDAVNDRFLVVWEDQRQLATRDDVYGRLISSDGTMLGEKFLIAGTGNIERRPVAAANSKDGTYLVVWESEVDGSFRLFSQIIDSNGRLLKEPAAIGSELGGQRNRPAVSYLKKQDVFLVVFDNSAFDAFSDGIYGQFVQGNGKLRDTVIPVTTATLGQYRPAVEAAGNTFLVVWTDYRDTADAGNKRNVYEYYGRVIGNDMALSSRWRHSQSK